MAITFDPRKREATLAERGIDFRDARSLFEGSTFSFEDNRFDYGELRIVTVGLLAGRMAIVVWTPRGDDRHVISMRKANDREQTLYRSRLVPDG